MPEKPWKPWMDSKASRTAALSVLPAFVTASAIRLTASAAQPAKVSGGALVSAMTAS